MKTALIDYGSGNLQSAYKALELAAKNKKSKIFVTSKSKDLLNVDKIVLPGVGTFSDCMKGLKSISGMIDILNEVVIGKKKPFLGICVGMQLLATGGLGKRGCQVQIMAVHELSEPPTAVEHVQTAFTLTFLLELAIRMIGLGRIFFQVDVLWNCFDLLVVYLGTLLTLKLYRSR